MTGNIYSEKLWIHERLRNKISEKDMKKTINVGQSILTFEDKGINNYVIRTEHINFGGIHYNDGRDYLTGEADIFLKDQDGNIETPREVRIYVEKDGKKKNFYVGKIKDNKYYFDITINDLEDGNYTIYAEAVGNNRKSIY